MIKYSGTNIPNAEKILIMLHGRGADANDILGLASHLQVSDFALIAPEAPNHTWYPNSFMAPTSSNEPSLSNALNTISTIVDELLASGKLKENIYFLGFSQGACLTLEFVTRNASRYGGVIAFTGGLIGDKIQHENYLGDFAGTPIFIGTSDPDPHVPVVRVEETATILRSMNADLQVKIYPRMGHTIIADEINLANEKVLSFIKPTRG